MFFRHLKMHKAEVIDIIDETPRIKSFTLKTDIQKIVPGQFIMLWVPNYEEIPISPSLHKNTTLRLTIANVGKTTERIHEVKVGERLFLRGPYGRGFNLNEGQKYLLIAGGYGAAPIIYAAHELVKLGKKVTYLIGAKTSTELLFVNEAKQLGAEVHIATDDGSLGFKGFVTDLAKKFIGNYDNVLVCGPEKMLVKIMEMCLKLDVKCQLSIERYMRCGVGICGSCALDPKGLLVCKDGPVFYAEELKNTDFGKYYTFPPGIKVPV